MHGDLFWWGVILSPWTWAFAVLFVVLLIVVFVTAFVRRRRLLAASAALQAPAPIENLVRFCPGCGSVGTVSAEFRDCCPDGGHARAIPESLAHRCHDLFGLALGNASEAVDRSMVVIAAQACPDSPTCGMNLGERIAHVGGRNNEQGYVEFGSPMAVDALIKHAIRDHDAALAPTEQPDPDGERYRYLRAQDWEKSDLFVVAGGNGSVRLGVDCPSQGRLDAIIDAAMVRTKGTAA